LTTSGPGLVLDNQRPRISSHPPFFTTLGQDAVDLAAHAGLVLDPWQEFVIEQSLGERQDGKWSAFEVGLILPRQNGKGAVIEARQLAAMFLTRDETIIYSAHQFKTAKAMYRRIRDLCKQTPDLDKLVKGRYRQSNEETGIELDWGRMQFFARSNGSGRGFTGDTMFFDEAFNLDGELLADMLPTLAAVPNAQVWYVSSAGMQASEALAKIRDRGITGEDRLAYFEWSAEEDADLDDINVWYQSNPAMGIRLDPDFVRSVERPNMGDEQFARERLGIWHDPRKGSVFTPEQWSTIADGGSAISGPTTLSVDVTPDRGLASIGASGYRADGLAHIEYVDNRPGVHWVIERVKEIHSRNEVNAIVVDAGGAAGSLIPELLEVGPEVIVTTTRDVTQACGAFFDAVVASKVRHISQPALNAAIDAARKRNVGDAWAWTRRDVLTDISPLVACTLALYGAARKPTKQRTNEAFFM
jgi:phage terminase large subunit-like protein